MVFKKSQNQLDIMANQLLKFIIELINQDLNIIIYLVLYYKSEYIHYCHKKTPNKNLL